MNVGGREDHSGKIREGCSDASTSACSRSGWEKTAPSEAPRCERRHRRHGWAKATAIGNGESAEFNGVAIDAIPAYNTTEGRTNFHPQGRDNGYVLSFDGFRVYISGDTEDIPEMRALENIDLAFLCMNLPFTMDVEQAASAVAEFKPKFVYPYHYRGRDGGTQDPSEFAALVGEAVAVKMGDWYA